MGQQLGEAFPLDRKYPQVSQYSIKDGRSTLDVRPNTTPHRQYQFLRKLTSESLVWHIIRVLIASSPLLFIVYAIAALIVSRHFAMDNRSDSKLWGNAAQALDTFSLLSPTLFPIVFSAVAGRLMRNYALWRAEKGANLGLIEQIHGSQSLVSALQRSYLAPRVGILGFSVVLLWFLSPVGGQSSARLYVSDEVSLQSGHRDIYYYDTTVVPDANATIGLKPSNRLYPVMDNIISRSLLGGTTESADAWGNPKIPYLNESCPNTEKCRFLDEPYYSSLNGILVSDNDLSSFKFSAHASYYNLTCNPAQSFPTTEKLALWAGKMLLTTDPSKLFNSQLSQANTSYLLDTNWIPTLQNASDRIDAAFNLIFATNQPLQKPGSITAFNCSVGFTHVEINGHRFTYHDTKVTRIESARITTNLTVGKDFVPFWSQQIYARARVEFLLRWLSQTLPARASGDMALLDAYIQGIDNPYSKLYDSRIDFYFDGESYEFNLDPFSIAQRLGRLLNTAWQTSTLQYDLIKTIYGDEGWQSSASLADLSGSLTGRFPVAKTVATDAKINSSAVNWRYFILTMVISTIILICGILGLYLEYHTKSPDILGYVSSLVRNNPHFEKVEGGSSMGGLEYAKAVNSMRVQLSSVNHGDAGILGEDGVLRRATRS